MDARPASRDLPVDVPAGAPVDVLILALGADAAAAPHVAVPTRHVGEVARVEHVAEYPGAPEDVAGVTAVRGRVVTVLDLTPRAPGGQVVVLVTAGARALALAGVMPVRVAAAHAVADAPRTLRSWSGRVLPLAGGVRLADAAGPDADDGRTLPLLDVAALIRGAVDDPDGESG